MAYITKKTEEEIGIMHEGGKILSETLRQVIDRAVPGAETEALDGFAREELRRRGAEPSFLNYQPAGEGAAYPGSLCVSINNEIVHGLAVPSRRLNAGDLVSFDIGAKYKGLYTDMAATVYLGKPPKEIKKLINVTRQSLIKAVKQVKPGNYLNNIGKVIEEYVTNNDFGIVRDLVGHGVGYAVHEPPRVPNYNDETLAQIMLEPGVCLAIEPMVTERDWRVRTLEDEWTAVTVDNGLSAHFEVTVAVTKKGRQVLTPYVV